MNSRSQPPESREHPPMVVVSNRLPVVLDQNPDGSWTVSPGSGGLVTALEPVLRRATGTWVGWPGVEDDGRGELQRVIDSGEGERGYRVHAVGLTPEEQEGFYLGFANQVIWPLFHGFPERCRFLPRFWDTYRAVTRKYAEGVMERLSGEELIWVHDYHLMGVAEALRKQGVDQTITFFLHTSMPSIDMLRKLPWRLPLLRSLLQFDLLGFHTARDRENFLQSVRSILPDRRIENDGELFRIRSEDRTTRVGVFPISIDVDEFAEGAGTEEVENRADQIRLSLRGFRVEDPDSHVILLGVDRLDYTKGLPEKLKAFRMALRRYPDLRGRVTLVQLVVPSREDITEYDELKEEIERLVGQISGEFTDEDWSPIQYEYGHWSRDRLLAYYRAARVALVTPLQDGMNLVAKEYCAANLDGDGVLVLSEHAGAAGQLHPDALLVNPYHTEELASAIYRACTMPVEERRERMTRLRETVRHQDIHWWASSFLGAARTGRIRRTRPGGRYASGRPDGTAAGPQRTGSA